MQPRQTSLFTVLTQYHTAAERIAEFAKLLINPALAMQDDEVKSDESLLTEVDAAGRNILSHVICIGDLDLFNWIIANHRQLFRVKPLSAYINQPDSGGNTALHFASMRGDVHMSRTLIESGAVPSINHRNKGGYNPLHLAIGNKHFPVVRTFFDETLPIPSTLRHALLSLPTRQGWTPLLLAAPVDLKILEYLSEIGANLDEADNEEFTALHIAACRDIPDVVAFLIEQKYVSPDLPTKTNKMTPLMAAAIFGKPRIVKLLTGGFVLNRSTFNVSFTKQDELGRDALFFALLQGHTEVVNYLVQEKRMSIRQSIDQAMPELLEQCDWKNILKLLDYIDDLESLAKSVKKRGSLAGIEKAEYDFLLNAITEKLPSASAAARPTPAPKTRKRKNPTNAVLSEQLDEARKKIMQLEQDKQQAKNTSQSSSSSSSSSSRSSEFSGLRASSPANLWSQSRTDFSSEDDVHPMSRDLIVGRRRESA